MELKGHLLYYPEGKHDINLDDYVQKNQLNDALKSKVDPITKTTYADLKNLRDNSQLVPGSLYRITDYQCTTTQENTRSAGHQFDIVLLALSENKLAEEGWAMMHDNIYDVVFNDGTIEKCYVYEYEQGQYNIVRTDNLLGQDVADEGRFDGEEFNAGDYAYSDLINEGLTYNYFQNSNLSAWKVWYCLDNDKSRFAWADDSVDDKTIISFEVDGFGELTIPRKESEDAVVGGIQGYAWGYPNENTAYTTSEQPVIGDKVYDILGKEFIELSTIESVSEPTGLPNGRGVIYRLIDEFNNDVAYDFKNIMKKYPYFIEENYNGLDVYRIHIDEPNNPVEKYVYTFTNTMLVGEDAVDGSTFLPETSQFRNNKITYNSLSIESSPILYQNGVTYMGGFVDNVISLNILAGYCHNIVTKGFSFGTLVNCADLDIGTDCNINAEEVNHCIFGPGTTIMNLKETGNLNYGAGGVELATKS